MTLCSLWAERAVPCHRPAFCKDMQQTARQTRTSGTNEASRRRRWARLAAYPLSTARHICTFIYVCTYMVYICICIVRLNSPGAIAFYRWPALIKYQRNLLFKLSLSANKGARCTRRSSAVWVIERRIPNRAARGRTHNKFDSPSLCLPPSLKRTQISLTHTQTHTPTREKLAHCVLSKMHLAL